MKKLISAFVALFVAGAALAATSTGTADLVSSLVAADGSYLDTSGNGANWSVSSAPTYTAGAYSGQPAWTFDGTTSTPLIASQSYYGGTPFNFTPPVGDWSAIIVADLNAATSTTNGTLYTLLGSGQTGSNQWAFGQKNRQLYFGGSACQGNNTWTGTAVYGGSHTHLTTGQPHVIALSYSNVSQTVKVCVDGCASGWQSYSISGQFSGTASSASVDATLWAGGTNATTVCNGTPAPWYGNVYQVDLYREALSTPAKANRFTARRDQLRAKYGTP